jgi:undecaprenyl-diphosphatase
MNDYLLALVLGIIEGVTEFLPVSSTAHLRIAEALMNVDLADGYWKMFSIVIQLGAILVLPIFFRARIAEFLRSFPRGVHGDRTALTHPLTLTAIAFVCTAIPSLLLSKVIGKNLESLFVMGTSLIVGGVLMWLIDARYGLRNSDKDVEDVTMGQAVTVGLCQALAPIFPGTSRSMATIASGELAGMSRTTALEFSFLLSIPTMAIATAYDFLKSVKHPEEGGTGTGALHLGSHELVLLAIGFVVSFLVAFAVVAWFMGWVRKRGFAPFAIYRILAGIAVLFWASH